MVSRTDAAMAATGALATGALRIGTPPRGSMASRSVTFSFEQA